VRRSLEQAHAILAFTYAAFDTPLPDAPQHLHYVGPLACLPQPLPPYTLPWPSEDARPLIVVSYSTSFQNQVPTLQRVAEAVAPLPVRVLMTLGHRIAADELRLPPNVVAEPFVPHAAVLGQTRLVVTHAGHGTVMAAVTAGVPMLCTPMGRDQYAVSECVERLGLGRVASMTAPPEELRRTLVAALEDDALHVRARTFAAGLDVEAGLSRALAVLETLQGSGR
jgi:MGT family glycosyltransferase